MARRKPKPPPLPTLEEQLRAHEANAPDGPQWIVGVFDEEKPFLGDITPERMQWARKRLELVDAIRRRDSKRLTDPGRGAGGNFEPSPMAARGGKVETAPKGLGKELPKDSQFPKRVIVQRSIDRLLSSGTITRPEWQAAATLLWYWAVAEGSTKTVAAYEADIVRGTTSPDGAAIKRMDAASEYLAALRCLPYHSKGAVIWVVINDGELSDWAAPRGFSSRHSRRLGAKRLSQGLRALVARWRY
jgi:hypothetical protein